MKKLFAAIIVFAVVLFTLAGVGVSAAPKVGDKLGDVLYTDIRTFIDGWYIDSYNIGGNTYVVVEDLVHYGFAVTWNGEARTLNIAKTRTAAPGDYNSEHRTNISAGWKNVGKPAMPYVYTDVRTFIGTTEVESFNIGGFTCICMDDLAVHMAGDYQWDGVKRTLRFYSPELTCELYPTVEAAHTWELDRMVKYPSPIMTGEGDYHCTTCGLKQSRDVPKRGVAYGYAGWKRENIFIDYEVKNKDPYSICIKLDEPGLVIVSHDIDVKPNTHYVVSVDVKTENVVECENPDYPLGANVGIGDYNHSGGAWGDTEWTTKRVVGKSNADGVLFVACCLGYYGNLCTGTAWFENIRVEELSEYKADDHEWDFLWVIIDEFEVNYYDAERKRTVKAKTNLSSEELSHIRSVAKEFETVIAKASEGRIIPNIEVVVINEKLRYIEPYFDDYYIGAGMAKEILEKYGMEASAYDHVAIIADVGDVPAGYWGLGGSFIRDYTGYTFARYLGNGNGGINYGMMWHEFMHSVETRAGYCMGFDFPGLHDMEQYPHYKNDPGDWWNTDYTNGEVVGCTRDYHGLPYFMWELKPTLFN